MEFGSVTLAPGENNFLLGTLVDAQKGYAYFVTAPNSAQHFPLLKSEAAAVVAVILRHLFLRWTGARSIEG
ncbi:MAG TPA: hypothetical protein VF345_10815 [Chthoniobacterales bacterium]